MYPSHLEGHVWGENIGWIRLGAHTGGGEHTYLNTTAANFGVNRTGNQLSGFAWGENVGWINFGSSDHHEGVQIDPATGAFSGYAWGENIGWIKLAGTAQNSTAYRVKTNPLSYTVTPSAGANGSISPSNPQTVSHGQTISFTVTANAGFSIASVTGCSGTLSGNNYTTGACTVEATFSQISYTVTGTAGTGGSINPTSQTVNHGQPTTFTVTPNAGYGIANVTGCGGSLSGSTYTTGPITAACTVSATFNQNTYTVTFDKQSGTGGSDGITATYGSPMPAATAPARAGYTFGGYYTAVNGGGTQYYTAAMTSARNWDLTANTTLYAKWTATTYTLAVRSAGTTSVPVTANPTDYAGTTNYSKAGINPGTQITLYAPESSANTPFTSWTGCDSADQSARVCTVTMNVNKTVTARYGEDSPRALPGVLLLLLGDD